MIFGAACAADRAASPQATDDGSDVVAGDDASAVLTDTEPHTPSVPRVLLLTTPDGSGQSVHPDFAQMSAWKNPFVIATTPYLSGNSGVENPTLYARTPDFDWKPFNPTAQPIVTPATGYLSDPDIVPVDVDELWVYYRHVKALNTIFRVRTRDGVTYDAPVAVVSAPNHEIVSPAVVRRDAQNWRMWSVNAGSDGCRAATTAVELRRSRNGVAWGKPDTVHLSQPGFSVWHIDVQWIPTRQEYWALYNVKVPGSCATTALYLATSQNGSKWQTYPSPVIAAGVIPAFSHIVYRSTFSYDPFTDDIRFWYSGAAYVGLDYVWTAAYDRRNRAELFASISKQVQPAVAARAAIPQPAFVNPP